MGQARLRGPRDARVAQALHHEKPPVLVCNACQAPLGEGQALDTRALKGITAAYGAHCSACDQDTWAVKGEIAAVKAFYDALEKASGQAVQLGTARPAASD